MGNIMNLSLDIHDVNPGMFDTIGIICKKGRRIENTEVLSGICVLGSDGVVRKGYDPDLITRRAKISISSDDDFRLYWGDGEDSFNSEPYFIRDGKFILGYTYTNGNNYRSIYSHVDPKFKLDVFYKRNLPNGLLRFLSRESQIDAKIRVLDDHLYKRKDKSGYTRDDSILKNQETKLKLLENQYRRDVF